MLPERADRAGVERRALQMDEGAAGRVGVEYSRDRRGRALDAEPSRDRGQDGREVVVEAADGRRRGGAAEVSDVDALGVQQDRLGPECAVGDARPAQPSPPAGRR
jgi:hypothetical protein